MITLTVLDHNAGTPTRRAFEEMSQVVTHSWLARRLQTLGHADHVRRVLIENRTIPSELLHRCPVFAWRQSDLPGGLVGAAILGDRVQHVDLHERFINKCNNYIGQLCETSALCHPKILERFASSVFAFPYLIRTDQKKMTKNAQ